MKKMKILNLKIEKKCQNEQNKYLYNKLKAAKPIVNIKCPESYIFYKTVFQKKGIFKNICN